MTQLLIIIVIVAVLLMIGYTHDGIMEEYKDTNYGYYRYKDLNQQLGFKPYTVNMCSNPRRDDAECNLTYRECEGRNDDITYLHPYYPSHQPPFW